METLKKKRESILISFEKAKAELQELNDEIDGRIHQRKEDIIALQNEVKDLEALKSSNSSSISAFAKFLR